MLISGAICCYSVWWVSNDACSHLCLMNEPSFLKYTPCICDVEDDVKDVNASSPAMQQCVTYRRAKGEDTKKEQNTHDISCIGSCDDIGKSHVVHRILNGKSHIVHTILQAYTWSLISTTSLCQDFKWPPCSIQHKHSTGSQILNTVKRCLRKPGPGVYSIDWTLFVKD